MAQSSFRKFMMFTAAGAGVSILLCAGVAGPCWRSWLLDGILVYQCPTGRVLPTASISGYDLGRGSNGVVTISALGHYVQGKGSYVYSTALRRFSPTIALVSPDGSLRPIEADFDPAGGYAQAALVKLPDVPDGDYKLRAQIDSPLGPITTEASLPLYAPALAHVLADSPLYKPGQTIRFRAVVMREADFGPLEGRPGIWQVLDPSGEVVLEEKNKAGAFGISDSSFPLDHEAPLGMWTIRYRSGDDSDEVQVEVKPFELPRFTVELKARPAYHPGDDLKIEGVARYTSGAPVADSTVTFRVQEQAASSTDPAPWPAPLDWLDEKLLRTDASGRFSVDLGVVPLDLQKDSRITFSAGVTDPTGEQLWTSLGVPFSPDQLVATAVTELGDGLVPSGNNRLFLRVTTTDGIPLASSSLRLRRAWDGKDKGVMATTDADGVARFQVDPGAPVTIVLPQNPVRKRPRSQIGEVRYVSTEDSLHGGSLDVDAQVALDRWKPALRACGRYVEGSDQQVDLALLINPAGRIEQAGVGADSAISSCVRRNVQNQQALPGDWRIWKIGVLLEDPKTPTINGNLTILTGRLSNDGLDELLLEARPCVSEVEYSSSLGLLWSWSTEKGDRAPRLRSIPVEGSSVPASVDACVARALATHRFADAVEYDVGAGILRLDVQVPEDPRERRTQPSSYQGFQYTVTAEAATGEEQRGQLNLLPGDIPALRLRFSEVLVDPGATVELSAVIGPGWSGDFPKELYLNRPGKTSLRFDVDPKLRKGSFKVPMDWSGYAQVEYNGARALLYIRPPERLDVDLSIKEESVRPGETASLLITTRNGDQPVAAGLTLSGVDSTLASLATLPGPDAFARITVRAKTGTPAFGMLDAKALETGQIRGNYAAEATIMRINELPPVPPGQERVSCNGESSLGTTGDFADAFYDLYAAARAEVRSWEAAAAPGQLMSPAKMLELWEAALKKKPATDAFGRSLHLSLLPPDLLALTDPRLMVADGTHLPEDVENWPNFVAQESP